MSERPVSTGPPFPAVPAGMRPVVLADVASTFERRLVESWVAGAAAFPVEIVPIDASRRRRRTSHVHLQRLLTDRPDHWFIPVRVLWFPRERNGRRSATWWDLLRFGDPRDPDPIRQRIIYRVDPHRVAIITGEGASTSELRSAYEDAVEGWDLATWTTRRAWRTLDRAERTIRGNRYKIPKFVADEILSRRSFRAAVLDAARADGLSADVATRRARRYLNEIAATHSPYVIDLLANAIHWVYTQGYGAIRYDAADLERIRKAESDSSIAFLPSHRSNMDRLSMQYLLWENDLPPNHTAAGINMNFFPVGPLLRRTGAFFIRRSFKDNTLYKMVLRSYIAYLVEKRFPLEWYMEGGRSRSGRLMPPRFGMLHWVMDAVKNAAADDVLLIPTSITYDQIQDVADYAREMRGGAKKKESFAWAWSAVRSLRRRYGDIHVRFGDPVSVADRLASADDDRLVVEKTAFEVMYQIGRITPITPAGIVSMALLERHGRAVAPTTLAQRCSSLESLVIEQSMPITEPLRLADPVRVARVLEMMVEHGSVSRHVGGGSMVYYVTPEQALRIGFYRNLIIHHFVPHAVAEVALAAVAYGTGADFWQQIERIRDLLKYEFFFADRATFRADLARLTGLDPDAAVLAADARSALEAMTVRVAPTVLLPILDAYQIVGDVLVGWDGDVDERSLMAMAMPRGERYLLEGRIESAEAVSTASFATAWKVVTGLGLDKAGSEDARRAFARRIARLRTLSSEVAGPTSTAGVGLRDE